VKGKGRINSGMEKDSEERKRKILPTFETIKKGRLLSRLTELQRGRKKGGDVTGARLSAFWVRCAEEKKLGGGYQGPSSGGL